MGEVVLESDLSNGRLVFLRDLYKDPLDNGSLQLVAQASEDLEAWIEVNVINVGFPLVEDEVFGEEGGPVREEFIFETGHEEGNARSLFMMRALRSPRPESGRDFFRLRAQVNAN